jgi:hypothetical protein
VSYTLRGRIETRLASLVPVLVAACAIAGGRHRWWPVELVALMAAVGIALDLNVWHRLLPYQPAWAAIPLGAVELGLLMAIVYGFGLQAPLVPALALFGAAWLTAFVLAQAAFPLLRLGYAEDGGELGRAGPVAVVRGGIVVAHDDVQIRDVTVLGGQNGITVDGVRGTVIDGVAVQAAKLDGIHVREAGIVIRDCTVDMLGNRLGQGIDISFNMGTGMSMVEGCTVVGGQEGITTHVSMTDITGNRVSRTTGEAISVDEMSMGMAAHNTVRGALGVGLYCNDQSMCMFEHNTVVGTRADVSSGIRTRRGIAVLAGFQSEANLWQNRLVANPVAQSAITNSVIRKTSRAAW